MAVRWTEEQKRAIETTDRGVVVPAAAGSGKTAVLIERTVRLLADKNADCPAEKLLAVTFTKDAANQMKNKLRAALSAKISEETDPETRRWLERQQEMLPLAKISTINSFFLELVKDNLNEFDYRAGIKIADETQAAVILDESLSQAMEEIRAEKPEAAELLIDALTNNSERELAKYIRQFYRFLRSLAFPDKWIEETSACFTDRDRIADFVQTAFYEYEINLQKALKYNEQAAYLAAGLQNGEKVLSVIGDDLEILESIKAALLNGEYETLYNAVCGAKFPVMRAPSKKGLTDEERIAQEERFAQIKALREREKKLIDATAKDMRSLGEDIYSPMEYCGEIFSALCLVTERLDKIAAEKKLERSSAEFGDVERMAMSLLVTRRNGKTERTELAEQLVKSRTYRMILIDEYQDVNNLQEMIFRAISDTDDLDVLGGNIFAVGDVKQSIYRFRLSNPALFLNAVKNAEDPEKERLCKIRLTRNFRSRQNVIDFVNRVFSTVMSEELGELEYSEEERLVCGAEYGGVDEPAELMLINDGGECEDELKYAAFGVEELCIARRIKQLIDSGVQTWRGKEPRNCEPSDFCVLSRGKEGCRRVAAALEYVGLKAQSEQTDGYMGSKEIVTMVSLLKVIDNPMKDLPMASVMTSPILGFTADETAALRLLCRTENQSEPKRLYQIILAVSKTDDADEKEAERIYIDDETTTEKCRYAARLIKRLRFYSVSMTLEALISKIYDETGFFAVASVYENSAQKRANLRLLSQRAAEYEKDSTGGIAGFLRYLECVSAAGGDFSQAVTANGGPDTVAVKTIHSSKGLEYPFVFLCSLDKSFNLSDVNERLLMNERMGMGINYMRHDKLVKVKTVAHRAMEVVTRGELLSEELRLLYVALTRAKERLFIPFYLKRSENRRYDVPTKLVSLANEITAAGGASPSVLRGCDSYLQWLAAAVMLSDQNGALLEALGVSDLKPTLDALSAGMKDRPKMLWREYPEKREESSAEVRFTQPKPDLGAAAALREKYAFVYPNVSARAASKRTVTEIVSEIRRAEEGDTDPMFYPQLGTFGEEAARLSASQRGTYTHLFMELADYENAERDAGAELQRLVDAGLFSEREAKGVYKSAVEKFFAGDFYARMKRSDEIRRELQFMVRADDAGISESFGEFIAPDGMLQGVCDCIFREDGGYVLVDYKTDGFTDISELDKYAVQLKLYKAALDRILPLPVKACYIYSFRLSAGKEIQM